MTYSVLYVASCAYLYLFVLPSRAAGDQAPLYWSYVFFAALGATGYFAVRRLGRRDKEMLHTSITGYVPPRIEQDAASMAVKRHFAERTHILRSLIIRASAECDGGRLDEVPRQVSNELLRRQMLWSELERSESELLSAPTGSWTDEQRGGALIWCEQLRLLRWISGIDKELMPLEHFPVLDAQLAGALPEPAAIASSAKWLLGIDARLERNEAAQYQTRTLSELITRGLVPATKGLGDWARWDRELMAGDSKDLLAGAQTIASLSDEALQLFACVSIAREQYCGYLADQLDGTSSISFEEWQRGEAKEDTG